MSRVLILLFLLFPPAAIAQDLGVSYSAYVAAGESELAIVETDESSYIIKLGQRLGDFNTVKLTPAEVLLEGPDGEIYRVPAEGQPGERSRQKIAIQAHGAPLDQVCRAVAQTQGLAFVFDFEVTETCTYSGGADSVEEALASMWPTEERASRMLRLGDKPFWAVGRQSFVDRIATSLESSQRGGKLVSFDFVHASWPYVVRVLATELGVALHLQEEREELGVTIFCHNAPASELVATVVASAVPIHAYRLTKSNLYVGTPEWLKSQPDE